MKKLIKEIIGFCLVKWFFFLKKQPDKVLSITFHRPSVKMFSQTVDWLEELGYRIIDLAELKQILVKDTLEDRVAFITIDDGWLSNLQLEAVINDREIPVAIFVPTEPVLSGNYWWEFANAALKQKLTDLPDLAAFKSLPDQRRKTEIEYLKKQLSLPRSCMNLEELKALSKNPLVTIGSHTVNHPILNKCSSQQQEEELVLSKQQLTEWLQKPVQYFAYPNGDYDQNTLNLIPKAGYALCFTDSHGTIMLPWKNCNEIPRNSLNDDGGYYENHSKLLGLWQKVFGKD